MCATYRRASVQPTHASCTSRPREEEREGERRCPLRSGVASVRRRENQKNRGERERERERGAQEHNREQTRTAPAQGRQRQICTAPAQRRASRCVGRGCTAPASTERCGPRANPYTLTYAIRAALLWDGPQALHPCVSMLVWPLAHACSVGAISGCSVEESRRSGGRAGSSC